ncbi:MAG: hypothetical protein ACT4NP_19760 [Pseudonocardiales bacterium]
MAIKSVKVSDLDGSDDADVTVVVREHPAIQQAKALDVTAEQVEALVAKAVTNVVTVEVRREDGTTADVLVNRTDLDKWLGDPDKVLAAARFNRGRQPGYSPQRNGS